MNTSYKLIPTDQISFDTENPRIKIALEKYGDALTEERIRFALKTATEGSSSTSSYRALKDSIRAAKGISNPIRVWKNDGQYVCVDGNTRLAVYHELHNENTTGDWTNIQCLELISPTPPDIETIRMTTHLVGTREWPAYEKARYLHYLRNVEVLDYEELIARCGGNKAEITRQIDAFHDMNEFYRDVVTDDAFKVDRFSGFVELQRPKIKQSIFDSGFTLSDFGQWIRDGKIFRLADVRKLPIVLADEEAREAFVIGGPKSIEKAIEIEKENRRKSIHQVPQKVTVAESNMITLAEELLNRIKNLPRQDYVDLRDRNYENAQQEVDVLTDLAEHLYDLLTDVSE
ncbi:MAG: hypothetical protein OXH03_07170 [Bacteroidetes bacterium]|nr:hypothetical protein [Bacteroidota bacterium]